MFGYELVFWFYFLFHFCAERKRKQEEQRLQKEGKKKVRCVLSCTYVKGTLYGLRLCMCDVREPCVCFVSSEQWNVQCVCTTCVFSMYVHVYSKP